MGKLTDITAAQSSGFAIGEQGLLEFIDDLNDRRAARSNNERYHPIRDKLTGILGMATHRLPSRMKRDAPSQRYAMLGPDAAVRAGYPKDPPWRPRGDELAQMVRNSAARLSAPR